MAKDIAEYTAADVFDLKDTMEDFETKIDLAYKSDNPEVLVALALDPSPTIREALLESDFLPKEIQDAIEVELSAEGYGDRVGDADAHKEVRRLCDIYLKDSCKLEELTVATPNLEERFDLDETLNRVSNVSEAFNEYKADGQNIDDR